MASLIEQNGGGPQKQPKYAPIFMERSFTGEFTQRSAIHDPSDVYTARFYGGRPDALWAGSNIELTNRLTLQRRPGLSALSVDPFAYPTPPLYAYSFQLINGTIRVIVDTQPTPTLVLTSVDNTDGTTTVYHGTITGGDSDAYVGMKFLIDGFETNQNKGTFTVISSSTTTLTLDNTLGIAETHAGTALSSGAVYWDKMDGTTQILFGKAPGAGQSYMIGSGGILFVGDGIDTWKWTPLNINTNPDDPNGQSVWNWGIVAPTQEPSTTVVASGAASPEWTGTPATVWSTMGLVDDAANTAVYQLTSVDYLGTNSTRFGTSGSGQPTWPSTSGTVVDGTVTWENLGPLVEWSSGTKFASAQSGGVAGYSCAVYDPVTDSVYVQISGSISKTGSSKPHFKPGQNQNTNNDGGCKWLWSGKPGTWQKNHTLPTAVAGNSNTGNFIVQPSGIGNGLPPTGTTYLMFGPSGTTAASAASPFSASTKTPIGYSVMGDGDLDWMALGSYVYTDYDAGGIAYEWTAQGQAFTVVKVTVSAVDYWQVCTTGGTTGAVAPSTTYTLTAAGNASGGNTTYTISGTPSPAIPVNTDGAASQLTITGFANSANNGKFNVISQSGTSVVVDNAVGVAETHAGSAVYNPWGVLYKDTTADGHVIWTCVGKAMVWASSTQWYLPTSGFTPPSLSSPYGGASILDSNSNVEFVISSGLGTATTHPTWNTTANGPFTGTGNSATTDTNAIWYNNGPVAAESLIWTEGYAYAYSYKARATDDFYSAPPLGGLNGVQQIPPGITHDTSGGLNNFNWNPTPSGSATEAVSSASPANTSIVSASPGGGGIITVSGVGSTDPQVDTIIIWRSADGGGSAQMYELTEIPNVQGAWSFVDFLPDAPDGTFPGLNTLIPAPINGVNNPPASSLLPMAYNFQRIWGADGQFVDRSGGPDTRVGNPDEAFDVLSTLPFLATVIRIVKSPQGLITFLTDSIEVIAGGPSSASFFSVTWAPGIGLLSYNALDVFAGEIYFFSSDNQFRVMTPALSIQNAGFPLGDQFANMPTRGTYAVTSVAASSGSTTTYTGTFNTVEIVVGSTIQINGFTNDSNNGPFMVISVTATQLVVDNALAISESSIDATAFNGDAIWDPAQVYVASHQNGIDNCIMVADGNTGWYRLNPRQAGAMPTPEPVWSPFASITNGCQMVQSVETAPGIKKLLVGSQIQNQPLLYRNMSVFTDNGTPYDAFFEMGNIVLAHPGQLALLKFCTFEFSGVSYKPTISYLLDEISGTFTEFVLDPVFDPPQLYGDTITPSSYSPNRYYFMGNASLARCRHLRLKVDFGTTSVGDEMLTATIFGRLMIET